MVVYPLGLGGRGIQDEAGGCHCGGGCSVEGVGSGG